MRIIGITGTLGAGKGTVVEYLCKPPHNYKHYSARGLLNEIIAKRGLEPGRDSMRAVANGMREKNGPAALIEALYAKALAIGADAIIESVRTEGEVVSLRSTGQPFTLLAVDADQRIRYDRAVGRGSSTDQVSFEKFCEQEALEMASAKPHEQNLSRCMELADVRLVNNGSVEEFHAQIDAFLEGQNKGVEVVFEKEDGATSTVSGANVRRQNDGSFKVDTAK
jgi:dephospho-CoA kinase